MSSRWMICSRCDGDGKHSGHLGAFTSSEWANEDPEFQERYMAGDYDRQCERCEGTGKVRADAPIDDDDEYIYPEPDVSGYA